MERATIELEVPSAVLEVARSIAEAENSSVEAVLQDGLSRLYADSLHGDMSMEQLNEFSDEQLWVIANRRLPWAHDCRWRKLQALNKQGSLTIQQSEEMEELLRAYDRQVLMRSKALALMKRRGHDIDAYLGVGK